MTPERWQQINALLDAVLDLPASERRTFLYYRCLSDEALRREVESLLEAHDKSHAFLEESAKHYASPLIPSTSEDETEALQRVGQTVKDYHIEAYLRGGGTGYVYRARWGAYQRKVALKFLKPDTAANQRIQQRFIVEAQAASQFNHPNICTVYDFVDLGDGDGFIVMPYYEGETLDKKIARGRLKVAEALDLAVQLLRGLARAHSADIIHRDIKPSNVMVTTEGVVKILDFGIAKLKDRHLTLTGETLGTPTYMSPEQICGEPVDARTDIWSVGVVLYEMLAGTAPFCGLNLALTTQAVLNNRPLSLTAQRLDISETLERIVFRCLEKKADGRYQSAEELYRALEGFQQGRLNDDLTLVDPSPCDAASGAAPFPAWTRLLLIGLALAILLLLLYTTL